MGAGDVAHERAVNLHDLDLLGAECGLDDGARFGAQGAGRRAGVFAAEGARLHVGAQGVEGGLRFRV
jgi:hypothetical protein